MKKIFTTQKMQVLLQEKEFKADSEFVIMTSYGEDIKLTAQLVFAQERLDYKLLLDGEMFELTPEQERLLFIDLFTTQPVVSEFSYDDQFHAESLIHTAHAC
jgi:hypothetical protein